MDEQALSLLSFFSRFKKKTYKKGATILRAQENPPGVFYLKKGYARLYSISKNAQELTFIIYKPDDLFPTIWSIEDQPLLYYTDALTAVEVYMAPREEFLKFIKSDNKTLFDITRRILIRFGGLLSRMEYSIFGNASDKVAAIILICAERFGKVIKQGLLIQVPLTHQDIANLLGIARETVSIEMKKLQRKNLIGYRRRCLVVKNTQKLKEESVLESTYNRAEQDYSLPKEVY